jgi:hypothetical protein
LIFRENDNDNDTNENDNDNDTNENDNDNNDNDINDIDIDNDNDTDNDFNNDPEKKDAIPLLIIDVNIRPGLKKKIYVYDGDTSDTLAERFAKEHGKNI